MEQLPVEAYAPQCRMTKRDPQRRGVAAAGNQAEGLGAIRDRLRGQEGLDRKLRVSREREARCQKCCRPEAPLPVLDIPTAIRVLTQQHELVSDFYKPQIRAFFTSRTLARLVGTPLSRHQIDLTILALDKRRDLVARSDAVEVVGRRDAQDPERLSGRSVVHARQPYGSREGPRCVGGCDP